MKFKRKERVELVSDYEDHRYGYKYKKGMKGKVIFDLGACVAVEFNGFRKEKNDARIIKEFSGEMPNVVIYEAELPRDVLKSLDRVEETVEKPKEEPKGRFDNFTIPEPVTKYYYVKEDPECDGLVVVFGTQDEIDNDCLQGDGSDPIFFSKLQQLLDDSEALCEDYLIESQKYINKSDIPTVKKIVEKFGYVYNKKLDGIGWG